MSEPTTPADISTALKPGDVDTVISGGTVYDGLGGEGVSADIALRGDIVVAIAPGLRQQFPFAAHYDATGCAVSPGFIDIHTHSDLTVLAVPSMASAIHQGVTTELTGNCGMCVGLVDGHSENFQQERTWIERENISVDWSRIGGFLRRIEQEGVSTNFGILTGHGTIRKGVMAFAERAPDARELLEMQRIVSEAMDDGAFGLSTGLEYIPGGYAQLDEIAALARIAHEAGGFYASHMRSEGDQLLESVNETIAVGERTGIPVQISHHKAEGVANWGKVAQTLARMQNARDGGLDVLTDQYPYTAFMTGLTVILLPLWVRSGSPDEIVTRLTEPAMRAKIELEVEALGLDYDSIVIGIARSQPQIQGMSLNALGRHVGKSAITAGIDLIISETGFVGAAHFALSEDDVRSILDDPHTMIGSDGVATTPAATEKIHPRSYGTFPRVLGRYVREQGVLSLPEAIRRMTSLPAQRLKLRDRGRLAPGMKADITIFRPDTVTDQATFADPHQYPTGIEYVFVNGKLAVDHGNQTDARAGAVLRRS
jgi:N-acyl-D-amino-acid deacylase